MSLTGFNRRRKEQEELIKKELEERFKIKEEEIKVKEEEEKKITKRGRPSAKQDSLI